MAVSYLTAAEAFDAALQIALAGEQVKLHKPRGGFWTVEALPPAAHYVAEVQHVEKGGRYGHLGQAAPAGWATEAELPALEIYQCRETGELFYRFPVDFSNRMVPYGR